ncbi:MAG: hypothetical protein MJY81_04855 [Bacteroidaceae bacterium]|nr:hypothetical protein [Bacteroidaceae bacterium]
MEEYNDKLHDIIKERLAERDRKCKSMKEWNRKQNSSNLKPLIGIAVAACLVGALFIIPWQTSSDDIIGTRSASQNIEELISQEKYDEALLIIEDELHSSDSTLNALQQDSSMIDEETEYEINVIQLKIRDLKEQREKIIKKIKK